MCPGIALPGHRLHPRRSTIEAWRGYIGELSWRLARLASSARVVVQVVVQGPGGSRSDAA
jgi:hypothetical protein